MAERIGTVLIGGAMDSETEGIIAGLADVSRTEIDGYRFAVGTFSGLKVAVRKTQMGKVNAALSTYIGIRAFAPDVVINQGTAGAHSPELDVGDIVVGDRFINADSYTTDGKGTGEGYDITDRRLMGIEIRGEGGWADVKELSSDGRLAELCLSTGYNHGRLVRGTIGTGDGFNREPDRILSLRKTFGTDCEEMEAFAVAQVSRNMGVPFLGFRVISNSELRKKSFDESTAALCCGFSLDVLRRIASME